MENDFNEVLRAYGRGWNCALSEAAKILRHPDNISAAMHGNFDLEDIAKQIEGMALVPTPTPARRG